VGLFDFLKPTVAGQQPQAGGVGAPAAGVGTPPPQAATGQATNAVADEADDGGDDDASAGVPSAGVLSGLNLAGGAATPPLQSGIHGFLSRLTAPDPDGVTFNDKLMAMGSILQGDSKGAASYLQQQRKNASATVAAKQKLQDSLDKQKAAQEAANDLAANTDAKGYINMQGYFRDRAAHGGLPDDKVIAATYAHNIPDPKVSDTSAGPVVTPDVRNPTPGSGVLTYQTPPKIPLGFQKNADGTGLVPTPGGPADPTYQGARTGAQAAARAAHPMPSRAKPPGPPGVYDVGGVRWH
jgi:hypothetical protein